MNRISLWFSDLGHHDAAGPRAHGHHGGDCHVDDDDDGLGMMLGVCRCWLWCCRWCWFCVCGRFGWPAEFEQSRVVMNIGIMKSFDVSSTARTSVD
jgi:hypothetical protein